MASDRAPHGSDDVYMQQCLRLAVHSTVSRLSDRQKIGDMSIRETLIKWDKNDINGSFKVET